MNDMTGDKSSEVLALAEAMNNLAGALRESNQLVRDMKMDATNDVGLLQAVLELSQRIAVLSTRIR